MVCLLSTLTGQEKELLLKLNKLLQIDELALKQKSRIHWLKQGDDNNHFFFQAMKERVLRNSIDIIYSDSGVALYKNDDIQKEIVSFYHTLLGSSAAVDFPLLRNGPQVSAIVAAELTRPITHQDIDDTLKGIADSKAPSIDAFNNLFFKKSWPVIEHDIYIVVL